MFNAKLIPLFLYLSMFLSATSFAETATDAMPSAPAPTITTWPNGTRVCDKIKKMSFKNWVYPILLTLKSGKSAEVYVTTNVADYHNLVLGEKNFWLSIMVGNFTTCFISHNGALLFESVEQ